MIAFHVNAVPVAQPRPRASSFGGKVRVHEVTSIRNADGSRKPHPIAAFKATVRMAAETAYKGPPLQGPLCINLVFVFPRPQSKVWKTRDMPRLPHVSKPDRDNCDKAVLDALKGLLFVDDAQVCDGRIIKWVASGSEQPGVDVQIIPMEAKE